MTAWRSSCWCRPSARRPLPARTTPTATGQLHADRGYNYPHLWAWLRRPCPLTTRTQPSGQREWWLTEDGRVTLHPNGHIGITDGTGRTFRVRQRTTRRGTEVHLFPSPDAA